MTVPEPSSARAALLAAGGDMGRRIADHDWDASPLGPLADWPEALVGAVSLMLPASTEIVLFWGPEYVALYNDAYAPTIGDKHPAALGRPAREHWAELWDDLEPLLAHVRTTGETYSAKDRPFYIERAGYGEEVYFDISYSPVRLADGAVGGVLCIVSETTARVRAARAAAADGERLAQMFDQAPGFMALLRQPGHVFDLVNASYQRLVGERELLGRSFGDALPEVDASWVALLDEVVATRRPYRGEAAEITLRRRPGGGIETRAIDFVYQPITDVDGRVTGVFIEGTDVTDRVETEQALEVHRRSLELATDAAEIGTWDLDPATDTLRWSARTKAMFGLSADRPVSMADFFAGLHPDDAEATGEAFAAALDPARRALYDVEYRTIGAEDGVTRWIAAKGRGVFDVEGRCVRAIGTTIDVTARRRQAEALRESEERFRHIADSAPALIWVNDAAGRLVFANEWFRTTLGIDTAGLRHGGWQKLVEQADEARIGAAIASLSTRREGFAGDLKIQGRDGTAHWIHVEGRPRYQDGEFRGFVGCGVDVTEAHLAGEALERRIAERTAELTHQIEERERVEATLRQMQRLEAVGQLTSGVAHDFNNLLTVVLGNVGLVERAVARTDVDARTLQRLQHVRSAAERGAKLTAQLLAFSRRTRLDTRPVDLNETILGMHDLLATSLGGTIAIETQLADGLWPALVDATQIELVILNLAINARDAMGAGGRIVLSTANVRRDAPERAEEPPAGEHVMVSVADSGSGMPPEVLAKAFEPFFTTKEVGKGSGLGLAQVYGFAKQSNGGVRIDSVEGQGTQVCVFLPRAAAAAAAPEGAATEPAGSIAGRTVLVLDDDDAVRGVTADELREAGCRVVEAAAGAAALEALASLPAVDAVVADFAMPEMNGAEFAARAAEARPGVPVLFVTGYADLTALAHVPEDRVIQKPYASGAVTARLRRLIDAG